MFRIFVARSRSVQQRSATTLRYLRPFHSTSSIRQSSSSAAKPIEHPIEAQESPIDTAHPVSLPSLQTSSTKNTTPAANDSPSSKTKTKRPRTAKLAEQNHGPAEEASTKSIKRRGPGKKKREVKDDTAESASAKPVKGSRRKNAQGPETAEGKAASKSQRQPSKSSKKSQGGQSENSAANSGSSIVVEERIRKASFTSQDIRSDVLPYLQWARGGVSVGKALGDKKRLNIVGESLCGMISKLFPYDL
jgi:hypothetical protein